MITDHAQASVKLYSLMMDECAKTAIEKALSTYPLYQGKKKYDLIPTRDELNKRLLNNYKHREIGFETVGRFLDELEITMCEIMPYYNELLKTVEVMADLENPFDNVDIVETFDEQRTEQTATEGQHTENKEDERTHTEKTESEDLRTGNQSVTTNSSASSLVEGEGTTTNKTDTNGKTTATGEKDSDVDTTTNVTNSNTHKRKFSDTPQNSVENLNKHLTEYSEETDSGTSETTDTTTTAETTTETTTTENAETANGSSTSKTSGTDTAETSSNTIDSVTTSGVNELSASITSNTDVTGTTTANTDVVGTTRHTYTKKGNQGVNTYAHDMIEFRTSIRDIVNEIINDHRIQNLFSFIW